MSSLDPLARKLADIFVETFARIEGGVTEPWLRPSGPQQNLSGAAYGGTNMLVLGLMSSLRGHSLPVWVTFGQALAKGFHVRKGEKSVPVVFYDRWIREKETGKRTDYTEQEWLGMPQPEKDRYERACVLKWYSVFNLGQTDFEEVHPQECARLREAVGGGVRQDASQPELDSLLERDGWLCPVVSAEGELPVYDMVRDVIRIPSKESFTDGVRWYGSLLREMAASTGSEERLDRGIWDGALDSVARERLVCELASATASAALGLESYLGDDSMRYLKSWSLAIDQDPMVIYQAVNDAVKASNLIGEVVGIRQRKGYDLASVLKDVDDERKRRTEEYKTGPGRGRRR